MEDKIKGAILTTLIVENKKGIPFAVEKLNSVFEKELQKRIKELEEQYKK